MQAQWPDLAIQRSRSIRHQIEEQVRQMMLSNQLPAGSKLPSTHDLARKWNTHSSTVHAALHQLAQEGFITRAHRTGTFVRQREPRLTCVGVYSLAAPFRRSLYLQALLSALREELTAQNSEIDVRLDFRPEEQRGEPWLPLVQAAERREFQALIVVCVDQPLLRWLRKLPVSVAVEGGPPDLPGGVGHDMRQFADLALEALAQQGCRSVGLITPRATSPHVHGPDRACDGFFEHFVDRGRDLGLTIKSQWLRVARHEDDLCGRSQETFGYEQCLELWKQETRPDGLVVHDDVTARGVILALREKQVRVPEELKLALHKNESIDLLCPMPATFVVSSERAVARALVQQVQKQFRGERCEPIVLPFQVMAHSGGNPHAKAPSPTRP